MPNSPVTVIAIFKAKQGRDSELKQELLKLLSPTRAEDGCINYDLHQASDGAGNFLFHENWTTREALDKHLETPHLKAFLARSNELLGQPLEITFWNRIDQ